MKNLVVNLNEDQIEIIRYSLQKARDSITKTKIYAEIKGIEERKRVPLHAYESKIKEINNLLKIIR